MIDSERHIGGFRDKRLALVLALALLSCIGEPVPATPGDAFWLAMRHLCGRSFAGETVVGPPGDSAFGRQPLVMDVRNCYPAEIRIPLHIGRDRSRVWILRRERDGIHLAHRISLRDGSSAPVTGYGGVTVGAGTADRQAFPADRATVRATPPAAGNVWILELHPDTAFIYTLRRGDMDLLRLRFDLSHAIPHPPAPWGSTRER